MRAYLVALHSRFIQDSVVECFRRADAKARENIPGKSLEAAQDAILNTVDDNTGGIFRGMGFSYNEFFSIMPALALYMRGASY